MAKKLKRGSAIIVLLVTLVLGVGGGTAAAASWGDYASSQLTWDQ